MLIKNGANAEQRDRLGQTALDYASVRSDQTHNEVVGLLTSRGTLQYREHGDAILPKTPDDRDFVMKVAEAIKRRVLSQSDGVKLILAPRTYPILPGDDSSYERLDCERLSTFTLVDSGTELGPLSVSRCTQHAQRARQMAEHGAQAVPALQKRLAEKRDEEQERKAGLYSAHHTLEDGSDFYFFPVIAVGHGAFVIYTVVLYTPKAERAVIVQAATYPMCEREKYKELALCKNLEQALQGLAVQVLQGNY
jgi:ankyrin repeat protein